VIANALKIINGDQVGYLRHKRNIHRLVDMRGGIDGLDVNLKISLLVYALSPFISWNAFTDNNQHIST
jgi:hypothetical protein